MNRDRTLELAMEKLERGQVDQAIDDLAMLLGEDPDDARAHALLSLCLLRRKRVHAAGLESRRALELEPESPLAHVAAAASHTAARRFVQAERHLLEALAHDPDWSLARRDLANLYRLWGRDADAIAQIEQACAQSPDEPSAWALRAQLAVAAGRNADAQVYARQALEIDPEHVDAIVALGHAELATGLTDRANEHAVWALYLDPGDEAAITLLGAIKARKSLLLGLWWRFQSFVSSGSRTRALALLIGMFLAYRVAVIALEENGHADWAPFVQGLWLAFCVYTWVAPAIFRRALAKELSQVRLKPDF